MGVLCLWPILEDISETLHISNLNGKTIAIDLSGWVVEASLCKGLKSCRNPHLRNTFFRTSYLLKNGVLPVFVIEGKAPELKEITLKKRKRKYNEIEELDSCISREHFIPRLNECKEMLTSLGVPCFESTGEAEAYCALLNLKGVVDGVMTGDSDVFLYGASTVYRNFKLDKKVDSSIKVYKLNSENLNSWNRQKLVAYALLLGCDYISGVPNVGKETALKLFDELKDIDILNRFKAWKELCEEELFPNCNFTMMEKNVTHCSCCEHPGTQRKHLITGCVICKNDISLGISCSIPEIKNSCTCEWCQNQKSCKKRRTEFKIYKATNELDDFPDQKVIDEYLKFEDKVPNSEHLKWSCPNLNEFIDVMMDHLGWTQDYSRKQCWPLITSWQLYKLNNEHPCDKVSFLYQPIRISKERKINGRKYFEVLWKEKSLDSDDEVCFSTTELQELFLKTYFEVTNPFRKSNKIKKGKQSKTARGKIKSMCLGKSIASKKDVIKNIKITDCFVKLSDIMKVKSN